MAKAADITPTLNERNSLGKKLREVFKRYFALTKPTITLLVVVTTIPGLLIDTSALPSLELFLYTLLGAGLSSASAATFNQIVEQSTDRTMARTQRRGVASGDVSSFGAMAFAMLLGSVGLGFLYHNVNTAAMLVAFTGHIYYVVLYTMILKKRTPQNIVIGGGAGAVGPMIGAAAITGTVTPSAWLLFALIFLWTPPHFWALALKYKEDYAQAGIPMYPVVYGDEKTRKAMYLYTLSLLPTVLLLIAVANLGIVSSLISVLLTLEFCRRAHILYKSKSNDTAMSVFHFSCSYTFIIFAAIAVEKFIFLI